jgi:hypothetical protein
MDYSSLGSFMNPLGTTLGYTRGLQFANPSSGLPLGGTTNATLASATQPFAHPNLPAGSSPSFMSQLATALSKAGPGYQDGGAGMSAYHPIQSNALAYLTNYLGQL